MSVNEAETKAACEAVKATVWIRDFLQELGQDLQQPSQLRVDNSAVLDIVLSPGNYYNCRTYNRDINYLRQAVARGLIVPGYVPSEYNVADDGTKLLSETEHNYHAYAMMQGYPVSSL